MPIIALIILLGFALRLFQLANQSFWYDEAVSLYYAAHDLPSLLNIVSNSEHPPLYFLCLHFWLRLTGRSEFSLRFLSLLFGLLLVPLTYKLGYKLFGRKVAFLSAFLSSISPFQIWYSQETRMYTMGAFFALLSAYLFFSALFAPQPAETENTSRQEKAITHLRQASSWIAYVSAGILGFYSHFYVALVLAAEGLFFLWSACGGRSGLPGKRLLTAGVAQGTMALATIPWLPFIWRQYEINATYYEGSISPLPILRSIFLSFSIGPLEEGTDMWLAAIFLIVLSLLPLSWLWQRLRRPPHHREQRQESTVWGQRSLTFLLFCLFIPILLTLILTQDRPKFAPRYLLPITPAYYILIATCLPMVEPVRRRWRIAWNLFLALVILLITATSGYSLYNYYFIEKYARDDFRSVAGYIVAHEQPDDVIILVGGHALPAFDYYYRGQVPRYPLPPGIILSLQRPITNESLSQLNEITSGHGRVWLVLWQNLEADPGNLVLNQFLAACPRLEVDRYFHGISLLLFSLETKPHFPVEPSPEYHLKANFDTKIALLGYRLSSAHPAPGETIRLTLYWQALAKMDQNYTVFVHILNQGEHIWGQMDKVPISVHYPTSKWRIGDLLQDDYDLRVLPGTPPRRYAIEIGLYLRTTMKRLPILDESGRPSGDRLLIPGIIEVRRVTPMPLEAFDIQHPAYYRMGDQITLLGYNLEPNSLIDEGVLRFTLFWLAERPIARHYLVNVQVLDQEGNVRLVRTTAPVDRQYSTTRWEQGEIVRDIYTVGPLTGLSDSEYLLQVALIDAESKEGLVVYDKEGRVLGQVIPLYRFHLKR
ncbi:MAG: glycosyltransferase family 39 protein [Chloroflexi bacterium]|nr:glycosyltransferase family 39 protein [Chloroflexota bacterium]MCL5076489.1 glycosyltransferase family 39 protein [Chloroflexota bacterium]